MTFNLPISELVKNRFSCRAYLKEPLEFSQIETIKALLSNMQSGPLGSPMRFKLIFATNENNDTLRSLGTYGVIKNPAAFLTGVVDASPKNLEDYGFVLEKIVLQITAMGLGSCWLGGLFTRSSFAKMFGMNASEIMPAVVSIGKMGDTNQAKKHFIRTLAGSVKRKPLHDIFFDGSFDKTLTTEVAGEFASLLPLVQWAPSASNKQPWRIVKSDDYWHFFLKRTKGYASGFAAKLVKMPDIQRLDIGIAMCHWELGANEIGLKGNWVIVPPSIEKNDSLTEYIISWKNA